MRDARGQMEQTGRTARSIGNDMDTISRAGLGLGAAVGAAFGASVTAAANFESSMAKVKAITNSTDDQFAQLTDAAKKMAADSVFGADQVSQAMYNLGSAGYDANKIIETMPGLLNLAAAAQTDLGTAAEITTSIMSGFGIEAGRAAEVADVLAQAANSSNSSIPDLGEAMKYVGPVAKTLGLSLEQTASAIGLLSNVGIKGSEAGTSLRASLLALINPSKESQKLMDRLGISVTDAQGKMKSLPDLLGHFGEKLKGMTQAQKAATVSQLVGTEAASGFLSLIDAGPQQLNDFEKALKNSGGTAKKVADTQMNTLKGKVEEFKGALENVGIEIGEDFLPVLTDLAKKLADFLSSFDSKDLANLKAGLSFGGTVAGILAAAGGLGRLAFAVRGLLMAMGPVGFAIGGLALVAGAIAGIVVKNKEMEKARLKNIETGFKEVNALDDSIKKYDALRSKSKLTNDEFARYLDIQTELKRTSDPYAITRLKDEMAKLQDKSGLSNKELSDMVGLNDDLIKKVPESTKKITDQGNAVLENTKKLKEFNNAKLQDLYDKLDLERLKKETEYKELLEKENNLIKDRKKEEENLQTLIGKRKDAITKQKDEEKILNDMLKERSKYSDAEIQQQQTKVGLAKTDVGLAQERIEKQAGIIQGTDTELEKTREKLKKLEDVRQQMAQIVIKQEGLTSEKGKELQAIDGAIGKLKAQKAELEKNTTPAQRMTAEYKESVSAIDQQIGRLQTAKTRVEEITGKATAMNAELGKGITKTVTIQTRGDTSSTWMRNKIDPDFNRHTGGTFPRKLHVGGNAAQFFANAPNHNEVDVRLLRNEMVLTEAQQANLFRMLDAGITNGGRQKVVAETDPSLIKAIESVASRPAIVVMDEREVGRIVEPHVTEVQAFKQDRKGRF
jgi:TP901 family phage tail tape measure protein